jgi:protein disulfide-isomerase
MIKSVMLFLFTLLLATTGLANAPVDTDGAVPGKWTMDLDAAKKLAAQKKLPILLDFSGSDWCGWCQVMEKNVFTKPEWEAYATNNLVMVLIDFPSDAALVPEKYKERNQALQQQYGVEGFPTFVVLDDDGETELGRLGSGQDKTPESFQGELEILFRNRPATLAKYAASLIPEDRIAFNALVEKLAEQKKTLKANQAALAEAQEKIEALTEAINLLEEDLQEFRVEQLPTAKQDAFWNLKGQFDAKQSALMEWIATKPEPTDENRQKFQTMQAEIQALAAALNAY